MIFSNIKCTECLRAFDSHFFGLNSGLGSPLIVCPACKETVGTKRSEWADLKPERRVWYVVWSIIGAAAVAFCWGAATSRLAYAIDHKSWEWLYHDDYGPSSVSALIGFIAGAGFVLVMQIVRIMRSKVRSRVPSAEPTPQKLSRFLTFLGTQANLFTIGLLPMALEMMLSKFGFLTH